MSEILFVLGVFPPLILFPLSGYAIIKAMIKVKNGEFPQKEIVVLILAGLSLYGILFYILSWIMLNL